MDLRRIEERKSYYKFLEKIILDTKFFYYEQRFNSCKKDPKRTWTQIIHDKLFKFLKKYNLVFNY